MAGTAANFVNGSGGTLNTSRFVVQDTGNPKAVNQAADATHFIVGISQEYAAAAPIPNASQAAATTAGEPVMVYQEGDVCFLTSTTSGWTAGDRLTSEASGNGITAAGTNYYGAIALTTMTGAGLGQVKVLVGKNP